MTDIRFYLGTHEVSWLAQVTDVPLFVSHRRLARRRSLPVATTPWALDSGGFTELNMYGGWRTTPAEYVAAVRRYRDEIGQLEWASPQDWMCEPWVLDQTGLTVADHQRRTVDNYLHLCGLAPDLPFIPVLQGWELDDYLRHIDTYADVGIDLTTQTVVGIGSVCRRQGSGQIAHILDVLHQRGLRMHGFGVKTEGLASYADLLTSADSLAWSFRARMAARDGEGYPGCTHKTCSSCLKFALRWRERILANLDRQQLALPLFGGSPC